jgi:hypothetical protein
MRTFENRCHVSGFALYASPFSLPAVARRLVVAGERACVLVDHRPFGNGVASPWASDSPKAGFADALLHSLCICRGRWCCKRGLNSRPPPYQGGALPLSYCSADASDRAIAGGKAQAPYGGVHVLRDAACSPPGRDLSGRIDVLRHGFFLILRKQLHDQDERR